MGTTLSSCSNECTKRCTDVDTWLHSTAGSCRFFAEVYRLSDDQTQWIKVHPEILSVRISQQNNDNNVSHHHDEHQQMHKTNKGIALLEATTLDQQQDNNMTCNEESKLTNPVFSLSIFRGTKLKRYTDKFVYWHQNSSQLNGDQHKCQQPQSVFALNLVSSTDLDRFSSAVCCLPPTPFIASELCRNEGTQIQRILLELISSERVFMRDLHTLFARFVLPSGLQFLQCVRDVYRIHTLFFRSLDITIGPVILARTHRMLPYVEIKLVLLRLFEIFMSKCEQFKVYSEYTFAYLQFQRLRNERETFVELISTFSQSIGGIQVVDSLLIKPIQRILKYPLFLQQIHDLCTENSEERSLCLKALKQMRSLANWLNEIQRIQEDYGVELQSICESFVGAYDLKTMTNITAAHLASLSSLQLFAHVRLLNPFETAAKSTNNLDSDKITTFNCALLVFPTIMVVFEQRHNPQSRNNNNKDEKNGFLPLVFPLCHIQLLFQQNPKEIFSENKQQKDDSDRTTCITSLIASQQKMIAAARFSLAVQEAQTDPLASTNSTAELVPSLRIFHFECCHADVCRYLALTLRQKNDGQQMRNNNKITTNCLSTLDNNKFRMEASVDSSCSSSSDRGYASGLEQWK